MITNALIRNIIKEYSKLIIPDSDIDFGAYLATFQFSHFWGNPDRACELMKKEIERFYAVLVTNVVRRPSRANPEELPRLIAVPDRPVSKRKSTHRLRDVRPNDGIHFHALISVPVVSRLDCDLDVHVRENYQRYLGHHGDVAKIDIRPINDLGNRLVDYTFKHIKRRTFSLDDVLILPKSRGELMDKPKKNLGTN